MASSYFSKAKTSVWNSRDDRKHLLHSAKFSLRSPRIVYLVVLCLLLFLFRGAYPLCLLLQQSCGGTAHPQKGALINDIFNETLGFQKILVLSMPSATDRRDAIALAASVTGLKVEFVDGVSDFNASKALPKSRHTIDRTPQLYGELMTPAQLGSWRGHMNALRTIIDQGLTSALILEDDGDWDVRIKQQMFDFARSTKMLLQPLKNTKDKFMDPSVGRRSATDVKEPVEFNLDHPSPALTEPTTSPYGDVDRWDILWPGHCGTVFPAAKDLKVPIARIIHANDETMVETQHFQAGLGSNDLIKFYPNHTRVTSYIMAPVCNLAYGVSLQGARRLVYDMGIDRMTSTTDQMLREICDGEYGRTRRTCLTIQPPLFVHHYRGTPLDFTANIKYSTRVNLDKLVNGDTNYTTNWPDGEPRPKYEYLKARKTGT